MVATRSRERKEMDGNVEPPQQNRKSTKRTSDDEGSGSQASTTKKQKVDKTTSDSIGGILLEYAKSGRASCRKCGVNIDKSTPRAGMEAWISGRQSMTWQHVICFLQNVSCGYEKTGRSKCSVAGKHLEKGKVKIAVRSHTATCYYSLDVVKEVLAAVLAWVPSDTSEKARKALTLEELDGAKDLSREDQAMLKDILDNLSVAESSRGVIADEENQAKPEDKKTKSSKIPKKDELDSEGKPKEGVIAEKEGTVEWKWSGGTYSGTLLPNQETEEKCIAKTHNGNEKTLKKGKDNWSMKSS